MGPVSVLVHLVVDSRGQGFIDFGLLQAQNVWIFGINIPIKPLLDARVEPTDIVGRQLDAARGRSRVGERLGERRVVGHRRVKGFPDLFVCLFLFNDDFFHRWSGGGADATFWWHSYGEAVVAAGYQKSQPKHFWFEREEDALSYSCLSYFLPSSQQ